ncbi:MAG TPA: hypothetical protein VI197_12950 [Polyangiaceae bacterium]
MLRVLSGNHAGHPAGKEVKQKMVVEVRAKPVGPARFGRRAGGVRALAVASWLSTLVGAAPVHAESVGRVERTTPLHGSAPPAAPVAPSLADLQQWHNATLYQGLVGLRSAEAPPDQPIVGDNTDPWGMTWTKCTNLGIDLITTLVAIEQRLVPEPAGRAHIQSVLGTLGRLPTFRGIFPENIVIRGGVGPEVVAGKTRYSSIDAAWVTLALSLVEAHFRASDPGLAQAAEALLAPQDYRVFVGADGLLGAGFYVDVATQQKVDVIPFSYNDRNSEARPLVLALVGLNMLPASAWDNTLYTWTHRDGLTLATSWHYSAFVELTGALFFDEAALAPQTLGQSHASYVQATQRVAARRGHRFFGYAPACDAANAYAEFGLDRPDAVSPYAAALLTLTGDAGALSNFHDLLQALPRTGAPLPDGIDPTTGLVSCQVARILDQALMFLALNADIVRNLVAKTTWFTSAADRLRAMDKMLQPPAPAVVQASGAERTAVPGDKGQAADAGVPSVASPAAPAAAND